MFDNIKKGLESSDTRIIQTIRSLFRNSRWRYTAYSTSPYTWTCTSTLKDMTGMPPKTVIASIPSRSGGSSSRGHTSSGGTSVSGSSLALLGSSSGGTSVLGSSLALLGSSSGGTSVLGSSLVLLGSSSGGTSVLGCSTTLSPGTLLPLLPAPVGPSEPSGARKIKKFLFIIIFVLGIDILFIKLDRRLICTQKISKRHTHNIKITIKKSIDNFILTIKYFFV